MAPQKGNAWRTGSVSCRVKDNPAALTYNPAALTYNPAAYAAGSPDYRLRLFLVPDAVQVLDAADEDLPVRKRRRGVDLFLQRVLGNDLEFPAGLQNVRRSIVR